MSATRRKGRLWAWFAGVAVASAALLGAGAYWRHGPEAPGARPLGPLSDFALPAGERMRFEGHVVQRLAAGSYTYLEVEKAGGERSWVVTLSSSRGARAGAGGVRVVAVGFADHFVSKRLGRSFDGLYFAAVHPL